MFCWCGKTLEFGLKLDKRCPKHGDAYKTKPERTKIGKHSGRSKSPHKFGDYQ
jgi:hypothetical protein